MTKLQRHWKLAVVWALSLVAVGAGSSAQVRRPQIPEGDPLSRQGVLITEMPTVVSGSDVGFRIERMQNDVPVGTLVVRIGGRWVEAASAARVTPAR